MTALFLVTISKQCVWPIPIDRSPLKGATDGTTETPLPTIWEVHDELWNIIQTVLDELDPPSWTGRDRIDPRAALNGILYPMRSGCQWNHLPEQLGDDSSVHRTFQRWVKKGVLPRI